MHASSINRTRVYDNTFLRTLSGQNMCHYRPRSMKHPMQGITHSPQCRSRLTRLEIIEPLHRAVRRHSAQMGVSERGPRANYSFVSFIHDGTKSRSQRPTSIFVDASMNLTSFECSKRRNWGLVSVLIG